MSQFDDPDPGARLRLFCRGASAAVILAGAAGLVGWLYDVAWLKSPIPGLTAMKANTALAFVLAGLSLWLSQTEKTGAAHSHAIAKVCAALITLIGLATLVEHLLGYDLAIDQLLALDPATSATAHPGRMSLVSALNMALFGAGLLLLDFRTERGSYPYQWPVLVGATLSLLALVAEIHDVHDLYRIGNYSTLPLSNAISFLVLAIGISCARADRGLVPLVVNLRRSLIPQVIALVVLAVLLSGGLVSVSIIRQSHDALRARIVGENLVDADFIAEFAWQYVQGAELSADFIARSTQVVKAVSGGNLSQVTADLQELLKTNNRLDDCALYDLNGYKGASCSENSNELEQYSGDRKWFQEAVSTGKPYLDYSVASRTTGLAVIPYAVPVLDRDGKTRGVLMCGISLDALADAITKFKTGLEANTFLSDRRQGGVILAHSDHKLILQPVRGGNAAIAQLLTGARGTLEEQNSEGVSNLAAYSPVPNLPWSVMILQAKQAAFMSIDASARHSLLLISLLMILTALAAGWLALRVTRPLIELRRAASGLAAGEMSQRLNFTRQDELGDLGRTFDQMAAALAERNAELKSVNKELQEQNLHVQQASRLKSEFLANMSHELRTPLNAIIGFAQLMYDGKLGAVAAPHREYLGDILDSARHLLQLINDILDLSKVEAGRMEFNPEPVRLTKIIGEVRQVLQSLSASKRLTVEVEVPAALEALVIDAAKLKQVLYNYLSNAIKFTPEEGRIMVRAVAQGANHFRLEVEDTGIGIAEPEIAKLFVEFQQLEAGTTKKHQGTGLGLALTKKIVEAQGGYVGVRSAPQQGSVFYAVLPLIAERIDGVSVPAPLSAPAGEGAPTVLIIEDDENERRWMTQVFQKARYKVEVAKTGAEGMALAQARAYDGILLDLILPDAGGWDVLRAIRAEGPNRDTPVIVATLVAEKGAASGFPIQDYLVKPIQAQALLDAVKKACGGRPDGKKKILVVDDDPNTLKMAKAALQASGYEAVCYDNGKDGLDAANQSEFCAVVLDLLMPNIDGFEFLDRFREIDSCRRIPVVVWTSKEITGGDRERLMRSAHAIALKGDGGVETVLRELQSYVAPSGGAALAPDDGSSAVERTL